MESGCRKQALPATVVLFGIKHSGKTSIGRLLSRELGWEFSDLDDCIEQKIRIEAGVSIRDFFRSGDHYRFFCIEKECLATFLQGRPSPWILATGGGIIDNRAALRLFPAEVMKIYLYNAPEVLYERIANKGLPPFLSPDNPYGSFLEIYESRNSRYRKLADITVDRTGLTREQSAGKIITLLKEYRDARKQFWPLV